MKVKVFLQSMLKFCFASMASAVIGFVLIPIISKGYPTDQYGRINMFYSMGSILMSLFLLGLDNAYIRFFNEPLPSVNNKRLFGLGIIFSTVFGLLVTAFAYWVCPDLVLRLLFGVIDNKKLILLLFVYSESQAIMRMLILNSRLRMQALQYNVKQILMLIATRLSFVFALPASTNYVPAITIMTCSTLLFVVLIFMIDRKEIDFRVTKVQKQDFRSVMKFSLPTMPAAVITFLNNAISKFALSHAGDFGSIGVLSIATSLANVFSIIPSAFSTYWSAFMYKNYRTEQRMIRKVHDWIMLLSILIVCGILLFQDVLYSIISDNYSSSQSYFMIIMLMPIHMLIAETTSYGITIQKKTHISLIISILTCLINYAVSAACVGFVGCMGAALGIGVSAVFALTAKSVYGQKYYASITSARKTFAGCTTVVLLCICNFFIYDRFLLRFCVAAAAVLISCAIYRTEVQDCRRVVKKMLAKKYGDY